MDNANESREWVIQRFVRFGDRRRQVGGTSVREPEYEPWPLKGQPFTYSQAIEELGQLQEDQPRSMFSVHRLQPSERNTALENDIAELRGKLAQLNVRLTAAQALYQEAFERLQVLEGTEVAS